MQRWVEIQFDCLPIRSVSRFDVPMDASPKYREFCEQVKAAFEKHGAHNSYYLHNAQCIYHLTNSPDQGMLEFRFNGTVITDQTDQHAIHADLEITLAGETCGWLSQPIVDWFTETVRHAVVVEFDRFVAAGDLDQTRKRIEKLQQASDEADGFLGMYL